MISGFTFGYNLITGGYPFVEAIAAVFDYVDEIVAVDCQSTDGTKEVLQKVCHRVIDGPSWEGRDIQHRVFDYHRNCTGDVIIMFEADEVYDDSLLSEILWAIENGFHDIAVYRLQVEQNFQRIREYPRPVHRVFPKGKGSYGEHPTLCPDYCHVLPPNAGYLWDCSANFRDNYFDRKQQQTVWGEPRHLLVAKHFTEPNEISVEEELFRLNEPHWLFTETPLKIPKVLRSLLGKTRYEVSL